MFAFNFGEEQSTNEGFNFGDFAGFNLFENTEKTEIGEMMMGSDLFGQFDEINNMAAELFNNQTNNNLKNTGLNLFEIAEESSLDVCKFNENEKKVQLSIRKGLQENNKIEDSSFEEKEVPNSNTKKIDVYKKLERKLISNEKEIKENTVNIELKNENRMGKSIALNTFKFPKAIENKENISMNNNAFHNKPMEILKKQPKNFPKIEFQKTNTKFQKEACQEDSINKITMNENNSSKNQIINPLAATLLKPSKEKGNLLQNLKNSKQENLNHPPLMKQNKISLQFQQKNLNENNKFKKAELFTQNFTLPQMEKEKNSLRKIDELNFNRRNKLNEISLNFLNGSNNNQNARYVGNYKDKNENLENLLEEEIFVSNAIASNKINQNDIICLNMPSKSLKTKKEIKKLPEIIKPDESKVDYLKNIIDLNKEMLRLKSMLKISYFLNIF